MRKNINVFTNRGKTTVNGVSYPELTLKLVK